MACAKADLAIADAATCELGDGAPETARLWGVIADEFGAHPPELLRV